MRRDCGLSRDMGRGVCVCAQKRSGIFANHQMNICGIRHEEIVYEKRLCPLCEVIAEREHADELVQELENKVDKLLGGL